MMSLTSFTSLSERVETVVGQTCERLIAHFLSYVVRPSAHRRATAELPEKVHERGQGEGAGRGWLPLPRHGDKADSKIVKELMSCRQRDCVPPSAPRHQRSVARERVIAV